MEALSSTRPSATHCSWARSSDPRRTRRRSVETCKEIDKTEVRGEVWRGYSRISV